MFYDASWLDAAGRLLIVAYFLISGLLSPLPDQRKHHIGMLGRFQVPYPALSFWIGMLMIWIGSLLLLAGWHADLGIYLLMAFNILSNAIYNRFWTVQDPMRRHFTMMLLGANMAVMGGLLLVLNNLP